MRSKNDWIDYLEHRMHIESNYLCHYGVLGMKWGIRKDRYIFSKANNIQREAIKRDPKITADVKSSIIKNGGKLYGINNRIKTIDSISRKMTTKAVNDALRYTAILPEKDFVVNYNAIKSDMNAKGYTEIRCKNYFEDYKLGKVSHKSVQCNYETRDGYIFEIQYQTKSSQRVKDKKIPLYEEARQTNITKHRKLELEAQMKTLAESIKDPPGINKIKSY